MPATILKSLVRPWGLFSGLFMVLFAGVLSTAQAKEERFFAPEPGYTRARDLPDSLKGKISSLQFKIFDAFEGSQANTSIEQQVYDLGNKLHINTREATVRRRLTFRENDTVTIDELREAEKNLRGEEFLADAIIEVTRLPDSTFAVKVTTYDQWTTVPGISLGKSGGEWIWWIGPVESNFLGTGQRLGFFVGHSLERDSRWLDYSNTAFTGQKLRLLSQYYWLSDGYQYAFSVSKPFRSRTDRWGFTVSTSGYEFTENLYLSGNESDRLQEQGNYPSNRQDNLGSTYILGQWEKVATHNAYAGITRAFGYSVKTSVTPFYERRDRYNVGRFLRDSVMMAALGNPSYPLGERHDEVLGTTLSLYQYAFKTVHNFRNLKWSESIETGWRLSASVGQNQEWLGADNPDLYFSYTGVYNNAWMDAVFLNSSATTKYFLADGRDVDNGSVSSYVEAQWKPIPVLATVVVGKYSHLFAQPAGERLYLGEESGLLGFPNFYYGGQASFLATIEQRFFPTYEFGTVAPALALFLNAGNTYESYREVDLGDLHYAVGVGLRLGATRSTQKVVNHFNLTLPIGEKNLNGLVFGVRASKSL
jgi:hypothetical protein